MKYTVMKCDCCGKTFYSEYWTGGYIDHTNLTRNLPIMVKRDIDDIVKGLCKKGNELRRKDDIIIRLNCFEAYCTKNGLTDLIPNVKEKVLSFIEKLKELDKLHDEIKDLLQAHNCTESEREYIGIKYQAYDCYRARKN